ncbi:hypothetical protein SSE37_22407 [Sagittula stellata E-37]|uniref:GIY-YIG domain-containing protein n=1 Tax=Sagittula stellata (strain ATCC 700073 / DSM 11524 / E-37) TaxID=388399 RepID=A3KAG4_SAGS3|nr:hypothetical protein SSE37_22407 [Sagittula stellata E-37]
MMAGHPTAARGAPVTDYTIDDLTVLGFVELGEWVEVDGLLDVRIPDETRDVAQAIMTEPNALYAFADGVDILYIGKTTRGLTKRFRTYRRPGASQRTNLKCNAKLRDLIAAERRPKVYGFAPVSHLSYGAFEINLAAGLEDSLIRRICPPWNGAEGGRTETESEMRERADDMPEHPPPETDAKAERFHIVLRPSYYRKGILNVGEGPSSHLGRDRDPLTVAFTDGTPPLTTRINRTANASGNVRLVGNNRLLADWFQEHFFENDRIVLEVQGPNRITLHR